MPKGTCHNQIIKNPRRKKRGVTDKFCMSVCQSLSILMRIYSRDILIYNPHFEGFF